MSTSWVHAWLVLQVLVVVGWALTALAARRLGAHGALRLSRLFLGGALVLPLATPLLDTSVAWRPLPQEWSSVDVPEAAGLVIGTLRAAAHTTGVVVNTVAAEPPLWVALGAALIGLAAWLAVRSWLLLRDLVTTARPIDVRDGVEVRVSDRVSVPFAAWMFGRRVVVLDEETSAHPEDREIALAHELTHHVHADTGFAYLHIALRTVCLFNPFAHLWVRQMGDLEELACDEAVVRSGRVSARDYGRCLLRTAERATKISAPVYAVSLTPEGARSLLHRRILALARPQRPAWHAAPLALTGVGLMTATAWATDGALVEVGLADVAIAELTERAREMDIRYPPDVHVVAGLKRVAGNPAGVAALRDGIDTASPLLPELHEQLRRRGLPLELAAIPLVASGYRNLDPGSDDPSAGAGLWMFVPETARAYGLTVSPEVDERLDVRRETGAALELLIDLYNEFQDWGLALAAWNQGRRAVHRAIQTSGTENVFELEARGALQPYASSVLAAALVLEHPEALDRQDPWWTAPW